MKKEEFKLRVARRAKTPIEDSNIVVEAVFSELRELIMNGESVIVSNFGLFTRRLRMPKKVQRQINGRLSKETYMSAPRYYPYFKFCVEILETVKKLPVNE